MVSTEIEPVIAKGRIALAKGVTSLTAVRDAMLEPVEDPKPDTEVQPFPPVPSAVVLTDDHKAALVRLKDVFAVVQPTERRSLTEEEQTALYEERQTLDTLVDLLTKRVEAIKEIARHHMDVAAEEDGRAKPGETVRDKAGHYVLAKPQNAERADIPGTDKAWSREYKKGSVTLQTDVIDEMEAEGEISRETYLAMTAAPKRVFNENRAMLALQNPKTREQALLVVKRMTKVGTPGTSLFVRKAL